nr:MAG TPA: hypothetical protein [Siphoviridae sp. ctDju21]
MYVGKTESPRRNHRCFLRRGKLCRGERHSRGGRRGGAVSASVWFCRACGR